jgi:hypothetical protein
MPFSVFPKFRATSAVLSSKVDAVIREMAALLNGGLSADNLDPASAFPLAYFAETKGLYLIRMECIATNDYDLQSEGPAKVLVPVASTLLGWGYYGGVQGTVAILTGPAGEVSRLDAALDSAGRRRAHETLDAPLALAAGNALTLATTDPVFAVRSAFSAVLVLSAVHVG